MFRNDIPFYTHFSSLPFDANSMMIMMITQTFRKTKPLLELNKVPQGHFWTFIFVCILPYSERELASLELSAFKSSGWWVSILCYRRTLLEISQTSWYPQLSQLSRECFLSAPEEWYGQGDGRGVQDGEHVYARGRFMLMCGRIQYCKVISLQLK